VAGVKGRSGRKPDATGFRAWAREVVDRESTRQLIADKANVDPDYALRLCEHAYGRPPQALDVSHRTDDGPLEFRILDATGADFAFGRNDLPTAAVPLPTGAVE